MTKSTNNTPTKKGGSGNVVKGVKEEPESNASSFLSGTNGLEQEEVPVHEDGDWMGAGGMDGNVYFDMDEGV